MKSLVFSIKGIFLILISLVFATFALNYAGAATSVTKTTIKTKLTCKAGSEPNARGTKCNTCTSGKVSSNGLSCRACRGNNIAKSEGANACTPCKLGTVANKAHTACIKQRYISGEREIK